ncbi:zinc-dependent peptidase [Solimonas variicoloris]|uniref:M90 family metallopeptidase n=1 Tax=Solimonas variicoloris TaxID=254408 RepID=UPI00036F9A2A|nr:M90 family metallopeptidase [Solimonas variicoloris]
MSPLLALSLLLLAIPIAWFVRRRRARASAPRLPDGWRARLDARVPQAALVPAALRERYEARVEAFVARKRFIGCNGLVVDDDMRLTVAGLAALLLLRDDATLFPAVRSVLLYPAAFLVRHEEPDELGLVDDEPVEQIGESWQGDRVILSWEDVEAALAGDAVNVVIHEFAHQLDDENPWSEGAPPMADYTQWSQVMQREYERLQRHRRPPVLDPYGAESPGEFFGVVSEAFFQRPVELRRHHAELYALLARYYRLDPAAAPPLWPAA